MFLSSVGNRLSWQLLDASLTATQSHSGTYGVGKRLEGVDGAVVSWDDLGGFSQDQRGTTIGRFPDGSAFSITEPSAHPRPARALVPVPRRRRRVHRAHANLGKPEGAWPLAGDSEDQHMMWVGVEGLSVACLEGASDSGPEAGRFASADPLGLSGEPAAAEFSRQL
ncbi:MAG: hypothetical protein GXP62_13915 [Oligoflexia bacterium]|nr:hypothetical protein [Oligoflexia bacterium]